MRKTICMLLVLCCVVSLCACGSTEKNKYEGNGFKSPEEAVTNYLNGLKELDFEKMLSSFAWETQAKHYSVKAAHERINAYSPATMPRIPSNNDFLESANMHALRSREINKIYSSIEAYILGSSFPDGKLVPLSNEDEVNAFLQKFNNDKIDKLKKLSNIRFLSPDSVTDGRFTSKNTQEAFLKSSVKYGADEATEIVAIADVGDELLWFCPTVVRYGSKWYIASVSSFTNGILGISGYYDGFACGKEVGELIK